MGGYVRYDQPTADYVVGTLTWNAGKGGISWATDAASEDNHGVAAAQGTAADPYFGTVRSLTGVHPTPPPPQPNDEFVSEPVAKDLNLNASRAIQLELMVKNSPSGGQACAGGSTYGGMFVRLLLGDKLLAGSVGNTYFGGWWGNDQNYHFNWMPPPPSGYSVCMFRMGAEMSTIPAGSILKLIVEYKSPPFSIQLGLQGDHRSVLRLPVYSSYEAAFRLPPVADAGTEDLAGTAPSGESSTTWQGALSLGAVAGLAPLRRRRTASLAVVALLALTAASGCLAHGKSSAAPTTTNAGELRQTLSVGGTDAGAGTIIGLVHDDLHIPVRGAHVSLLGSPIFAETDGRGGFVMSGVAPAAYTMRVDAKTFHSLERPIDVEVGRITRVDVLLLPLALKESDFRPHHHDYWSGADSILVMDKNLGIDCTTVFGCEPVSSFTLPPAKAGETPNLVRPGTYMLDVLITWKPAETGRAHFGLKLDANNDPSHTYQTNFTHFYPRASGEAFHIASNWEMTDVGHQYFSTWKFSIYPMPGEGPTITNPDFAAYYVDAYAAAFGGVSPFAFTRTTAPSFHVKVTIHKGVIPLEPEHPEFWSKGDVIDIGKHQGSIYGSGLSFYTDAYYHTCYEATNTYNFLTSNLGQAGKIIPPGTKWLELKLESGREPTPEFDWVLRYKDGSSGPVVYYSYRDPNFKRAPEVDSSGGIQTFKFKVDDTNADNMYAKKSSWWFDLVPSDQDAACHDFHIQSLAQPGLGAQIWKFTATVKAHRDPM